MSDIEELEERIQYLEEVISAFVDKVNESDKKVDPVDTTWVWDVEQSQKAAKSLANAFGWEDCPKKPTDFDDWVDLHRWLDSKIPDIIKGE